MQAEPIDESVYVVTLNVMSEPLRGYGVKQAIATGRSLWGGLAVWVRRDTAGRNPRTSNLL